MPRTTLSPEDKKIAAAFQKLAEALGQKDEILGTTDSRVRAGMLGIVLQSVAEAQLALVTVLGGEISMAERQTRRGDPLPGE